jgi:hypothetical protein
MKLRLLFWLVFGLPLLTSLLTFNEQPAWGRYSRCRSVTREAPTPYCFKRGDSGILIKVLVEDLREAGYYHGKTTTVFNTQVEQAVINFQKDYRIIRGHNFAPVLAVDGIVGENTLIRLCQAVGRGCTADADYACYMGSPVLVSDCLKKYKR